MKILEWLGCWRISNKVCPKCVDAFFVTMVVNFFFNLSFWESILFSILSSGALSSAFQLVSVILKVDEAIGGGGLKIFMDSRVLTSTLWLSPMLSLLRMSLPSQCSYGEHWGPQNSVYMLHCFYSNIYVLYTTAFEHTKRVFPVWTVFPHFLAPTKWSVLRQGLYTSLLEALENSFRMSLWGILRNRQIRSKIHIGLFLLLCSNHISSALLVERI